MSKCIIVCAPSGSGKTTIVKHLIQGISNLRFSVSATTRSKRENETHGLDYFFISKEKFNEYIQANAFIEWEEVYAGTYYGTLKSEIDKIWKEGCHVIFDVDVVGGLNLSKYFGKDALSIFIQAPSLTVLEARLRKRGTESEEKIMARVSKAEMEMSYAGSFSHVIINDELSKACEEALTLVKSFIQP